MIPVITFRNPGGYFRFIERKAAMVLLWVLVGLLALPLVLAVWLLVSALVIEIDSEKNRYEIKQGGLYKIALFSDSASPFLVKCRVLFVTFSFRLDRLRGKRKQETKPKPNKKRKVTPNNRKVAARALRAVWRSLQLDYLHVAVDTGSAIWNAVLIPPAQVLSDVLPDRYSFQINFMDQNRVAVRLELRPARVLKHMFIQKPDKKAK